MIIQHQQTETDAYWLAQQDINGQRFLAEGNTRHGAMVAMLALTHERKRPQLSPEEWAEKIGYSKCKQAFARGMNVKLWNPYPAGSPEDRGWRLAVSVIGSQLADQMRMRA